MEEITLKLIPMISAIVSLTIIESIALFLGYNGSIFFPVVVTIAGLGGYSAKQVKDMVSKPF